MLHYWRVWVREEFCKIGMELLVLAGLARRRDWHLAGGDVCELST
jgi:hypothetical protein